MAQDPNSKLTFNVIMDYALFDMTPACGAVMLLLNGIGPLSHWFIHRRNSTYFKDKAWALVNAWAIYVLKMVSIMVFVMNETGVLNETG
eukprot:CAMPEP_0182616722 /NCGR_PEP_ID=MMETSP1330-20130603/39407_1 /TAXON_ID=464278 /ORGANISM="Picochlorum sp., Strain RCC944" /LENGTH=88 /DNA_ID=CAMNT_0024836785 /DNA_START=34 /DNA_END=297 /DNA_ORIENTATION=-